MRNTLLLIKNYCNCAIGSLLGKKKQRTKNITGIVIIGLLIVGFMAFFGFSAWGLGYMATHPEPGEPVIPLVVLLAQGFMTASIVVIVLSLQKVTGGQRASDIDLLLSMPFTKVQIVVAKAVSRYLFNLALAFVFAFPYVFMYLYFAGFSLSILLASLLIILLVPFLAIGVCYVIDFITVILFRKAAFGSILKSLFTIAIIVVMVIMLSTQSHSIIGPINWLVDFAVDFDITALLKILAVTILPAIFGLWLFSATLTKQGQVAKSKTVDVTRQPNHSAVMGIFRKEVNKYINTPIYIINTIIGPLIIIGITIWMLVDGGGAFVNFSQSYGLPFGSGAAAYALILFFSMASAFTIVSANVISLEGKNLWILKTMPIDTRTVLFAKTLLNLVLVIPILLVCSILLFFFIEMTVVQLLLVIAMPLLVNIIISFGGLFINLLYPKLEWESEAAVVKQSMAVVLTMLIGFAVAFLPVIITLVSDIENFETVLFLSLGINILLALGAVVLTMTKGKKLYDKL